MTKKASNKVAREGRIEFVRLGEMAVPESSQRKFDQAWADHIVSEFDLEQIGHPTLSMRDGHYFILDGQHRIDAIKRWLGDGWESQLVECYVYVGLSEQQEADKFLRLNDAKQVSAFDKFRVGISARREEVLAIKSVLDAEGLCVSRDKVPGGIGAVGTLRKIFKRAGPETLGKSLRIIRDAYGDAGFEARVIDGISHLCQRYNGTLEEPVAIDRLSNAHGGVNGLLARAEVLHKQTGNTKAHCVAAAAVDIINSRRGGKKLPSWWKD